MPSVSLNSPPNLWKICSSFVAVTAASTLTKPAALIAVAIITASSAAPVAVNSTVTASLRAVSPCRLSTTVKVFAPAVNVLAVTSVEVITVLPAFALR